MKRRGFLKSLPGMLALPLVAKAFSKDDYPFSLQDYAKYKEQEIPKAKVNLSIPLDSLPSEAVQRLVQLMETNCPWQTEAKIMREMRLKERWQKAFKLADFNQET